ncbi:probable E3 ubiquitin-protein ligase makorin-1 isoform X1 [Sycon ciliatum]|uniref:probable E3 ubiquitin-protein ligase makorin-1 isoform X1 n=1 Tax=Sycon ciliatum TaxID=27933 RepID=UPI0031F6C0D5
MASGGGFHPRDDDKSVQCRYFVSGVCKRGSSCSFSHDFNAKPDNVCRYYQHGGCGYGKKCRYDHVRQKPDTGSAQRGSSMSSSSYSGTPSSVSASNSSKPLETCSWSTGQCRDSSFKPCTNAKPEPYHSKMTVLRKTDHRSPKGQTPANWADAPAFVPKSTLSSTSHSASSSSMSYSNAAAADTPSFSESDYCSSDRWDAATDSELWEQRHAYQGYAAETSLSEESSAAADSSIPPEMYHYVDDVTDSVASALLCPYAQMGNCPFGDECSYLHGDICDLCQRQALHPTDLQQRKAHEKECAEHIEKEMEVAFAEQRTQGVACGICLDVVCERPNPAERYFGLLSECKHAFCLACIRKWRSAPRGKTVVRTCPACRVPSFFVTPSRVWVEDPDEKKLLIGQYKSVLSNKPCKYFKEGKATCPFSDSCFYRHANPDGSLALNTKPVIRHKTDADGQYSSIGGVMLAGFLFPEDLESDMWYSL